MSSKSKRGGQRPSQGAGAPTGPLMTNDFAIEPGGRAIRVNVRSLRPEHLYHASWVGVRDAGPFVHLLFSDPLDERLSVDLVLVFEVSKHKMKEIMSVNEWATKALQNPVENARTPYDIDTSSARYHLLRSNLVSAAFSDVDAEIRFFHVSPQEVADLVGGRGDGISFTSAHAVLIGLDLLHGMIKDVLELL